LSHRMTPPASDPPSTVSVIIMVLAKFYQSVTGDMLKIVLLR